MGSRIRAGALAGIAGGMIFGMMMGMMGMLPVIAGMVGSTSPVVGFGVHLMMSAMIGIGFAVALSGIATTRSRSIGAGLAYGMAWWVIGPLTMMPLMMGMGIGANWTASGIAGALPSLMGHMIYGAITGFVYHQLLNPATTQRAARAA